MLKVTYPTSRLSLSPLASDDAAEMMRVLDDVRLHEFIGGAPLSAEDLRVRYEKLAQGRSADGLQIWINLIVRLAASDDAIGTVQATVSSDRASVAWVIGTPWQGRGYAVEATSWLLEHVRKEHCVREVLANIHPRHAASQRVAVRLGFARTDQILDGEEVWRLELSGSPPREVITRQP